ncbi:hypothetical protein BH09BAC3_BH09BAC3_11840 [soil metagenome]
MKKSITSLLLFIITMTVAAQTPDYSGECKKQMSMLRSFTGKWKGEAVAIRQGGVKVTILQQETIEFRLDSLIIQMEGIGSRKDEPGKIHFHALGLLTYDPFKKTYGMKSYVKEGLQIDAFFRVIEKNKYEWGFDTNGGKILYTITIDPTETKWNEKGSFSPDGKAWSPFFEMNLDKVK